VPRRKLRFIKPRGALRTALPLLLLLSAAYGGDDNDDGDVPSQLGPAAPAALSGSCGAGARWCGVEAIG
jgi:hypothetical protein